LPDSRSSRAKIESDNVIIKADDMLIKDKADLINYIQTKSPGDNLALTIIDNSGVTKAYDLNLESMPAKFGG
jgi:S1-C subfamily serine protease